MEDSSRLSYRYIAREITVVMLLGLFIPIAGSSRGQLELGTRVLTHVTMIVILLIWLGYKAMRVQRLPRTALDLPMVLILLATVVGTVFSLDPRLSLDGLLLMPIYALYFYLIVDLLRNGWPSALFVRALMVATAIACVLGIQEAVAWYLGWYEIGGSAHPIPPTLFRISTSVGGPNQLAAYINLVLPLAVVETLRARRPVGRIALIGWFVLALTAECLTLSRGGLLGLTSGVMVTAIMVGESFRRQGRLDRFTAWVKSRKPTMAVLVLGVGLAGISAALLGCWLVNLPSRRGSSATRIGYYRAAVTVFREHPLTGAGYSTYPTQYQRFVSIPPMPPTSRAHNVVLTIAAELGLLGLAAGAIMVVTLSIALRNSWGRSRQSGQLLMAGCVGGLAGALSHGMVDDFLHLPIFVCELCILVALALEANGRPKRASFIPTGLISRGRRAQAIAVLFVILAALLLWTDVPYHFLVRGAELARQARWEAASHWISKSAEMDPNFPFYHFQLGFTYGNLASSQPQLYLGRAIKEYEKGLAFERNYSLNHANLAALYYQAGRRDQALQAIRRAIELAPRASLYHIQLGSYYEEMGLHDEAKSEYERALQLEDALAQDTFWKRTSLRKEFMLGWESDNAEASMSEAAMAWQDYMNSLWQRSGGESQEEARYHFQVSAMLGDHTAGHMMLGRLAHQQGNLQTARREYEMSVRTVLEPDSYGLFVYHRIGHWQSALPQLPDLGFTTTLVQSYTELGAIYEELGELDLAQRSYEIVLEHDPTFQPALARLEVLQQRHTED